MGLRPLRVAVAESFRFVNGTSSEWGVREEEHPPTDEKLRSAGITSAIKVTFNLRGFPLNRSYFEANKLDSYLIQHWQMSKCRQLLLDEEARGGFKYVRVGRLRPDVLIWPVGQTAERELSCFESDDYSGSPKQTCLAKATADWRKGMCRTDKRLRALYRETEDFEDKYGWFLKLGIDLAMFGSRSVMIDKALVGLSWLHARREHRGRAIDFNPGRWPGCVADPQLQDDGTPFLDDGSCYLDTTWPQSGRRSGGGPGAFAFIFLGAGKFNGEIVRIARDKHGQHLLFLSHLGEATMAGRQLLTRKLDPELVKARESQLRPKPGEELSPVLQLEHKMKKAGFESAHGLLSTCAVASGEGEVALMMDVYMGLPVHWGAALRRQVLPTAHAIYDCLHMRFCNGQAQTSYGDDQLRRDLHRNILDRGADSEAPNGPPSDI
eukprot:g240.t1